MQACANMNYLAVSIAKASYSSMVKIRRNPNYKILSTKDVNYFLSVVGPNGISQDPDVLKVHNEDWTHRFIGKSNLVIFPINSEQISQILAYCNQER